VHRPNRLQATFPPLLRTMAARWLSTKTGDYARLLTGFVKTAKAITCILKQPFLKLQEDVLRHLIVSVEAFQEGPSAVVLSKQRDERSTSEGGYGGRGDRDEGYRPRPPRSAPANDSDDSSN
jgi:hypothetical protein